MHDLHKIEHKCNWEYYTLVHERHIQLGLELELVHCRHQMDSAILMVAENLAWAVTVQRNL